VEAHEAAAGVDDAAFVGAAGDRLFKTPFKF
jgi:hypothetical protein